ncbi:MAG TPA: XVIPCD domain-containing protein [Lysobacter sp.]|jgi:hypothetical protein|nr:XVIPCD domain-containing protein [Lysobacter sp.]
MEASVTLLARENGLTRVDHVVLGAGNGDKVFVVQGKLDSPDHLLAHMPTQAATSTPVTESFRQLAQRNEQHAHSMLAPGLRTEHMQNQMHAEHQEGMRRVLAP